MTSVKSPDYSKLLKNAKTGWVLISEDQKKIIAQAQTLLSLHKKIKAIGNPKGQIMVASKSYSNYIGA
jgi:hypothetical protein